MLEEVFMKSIIISSNKSGGGKTTFTLGLMKTLISRGFKIQGYKVGPDYIDTAFHTHITSTPSRNLDLFLMGEEGVKASYSRGTGDFGVIEGVMGLYDGKGISDKYSTYHVSKVLNVPVILVISPKAQSNTLCAELKGIQDYKNVNISGIVLNNITENYYKLLKVAIEKNCNIKVFGYIPKDNRLEFKSRHLGLVQSSEISNLDEKIQICSELIEKYVDVNSIIDSFKITNKYKDTYHLKNKNLKIAIAYDKAFSFYYRENLELLKEAGDLIYFSPLKDKCIPKDIDFLYIGGGYPEVFSKELSSNIQMKISIKAALENGLNCYAECGGLMYLTNKIEENEMVGFFNGNSYMTSRLKNFGYATLSVCKQNTKLFSGLTINCHEFHKSYIDTNETTIYKLTKEQYDNTLKIWNCGYVKNNTLGAYAHVHFMGNLDFIKNLLKID